MTDAHRADFPAAKHRAATVEKAFDGAPEIMTQFGKLSRQKGAGNKGWCFRLSPGASLSAEQPTTGNQLTS